MQAVILAGGKGTRLRPYTTSLPKPLVPIGDYPIIEVILRQLKRYGFHEVIISTGHLAELIESYCGNGRKWGLRIRYVHETRPLSTAGALKLVRGLKADFMTINGDLLTTLDYRKLAADHKKNRAAATIAICERRSMVDFGVIELDASGALATYREKPTHRYKVSMGVNIFSKKALSYIKKNETLGIPDLIARLRGAGHPVRGYVSKAEWLDIGRPEDYAAAQDIFESPRRRARYMKGSR